MPTYAMQIRTEAEAARGVKPKEGWVLPSRGLSGGPDEAVIAKCEAVVDLVGALFDIPGRELRRPGKSTTGIARTRQIAMYVAHVALQLSMSEVGRGFSRDRTTVLHACHLVEDMRDDPDFDRVVATAERITLAAFQQF